MFGDFWPSVSAAEAGDGSVFGFAPADSTAVAGDTVDIRVPRARTCAATLWEEAWLLLVKERDRAMSLMAKWWVPSNPVRSARAPSALPRRRAPVSGCVWPASGVSMARVQGVSEGQRLETTGVGGAATATMARAPRAVPVTPARSTTATATRRPSTPGASGATHQEHGALAAVALAVEQANAAKAERGTGKRKRNGNAAADEAALRAGVAGLIAVLSSLNTGSKEFCEAVNVVKYVAYLGHKAKHLQDKFGPLVTPAHEEVAAALRRVVRELCLELSPGIRNVREGTHDVRASHSTRHNVAFLCAVQESLLRRGSWLTH